MNRGQVTFNLSSPDSRDSVTTVKAPNPTILLTLVIGFQAFTASVLGDMVVMCLGGGHEHSAAEVEHCESACRHGAMLPMPVPDDGHNCGCVDVELSEGELLALPRHDEGSAPVPVDVPVASWGIILQSSGLGRRGPPPLPRWFDPGREQHLAIVASVQLTL